MNNCTQERIQNITCQLPDNYQPMLVVIDPAVEEAQKLATGVKKDTKVLILDRQQDSIEQIALALEENSKFSSVHLVCHGSPGQLYLGSNWLSLQTIERYAERLKLWSNQLSGASLSIYGCQVADGEGGRIFLQRLHHLTGANIAASTQKVGNAKRGGNWQLDYQIGQVEQAIAFTPELTQTYSGIFIPQVGFTTSPNVVIESEEDLFTFRFELSEPPPSDGVTVAVNGDVPQSLNQFDLFDIRVEGADFPVGDFDFSGFTVNITSQVATVSLPGFQDGEDEENTEVTYTLAPGSGYTVDSNANSSSVTLVDTPAEVPDDGDGDGDGGDSIPVVGITAEPTTLVEEENTETTLTFTLSEPPPEEGVDVTIDSDIPDSLAELDVFAASFEGARLVTANDDSSGFTVRITQQNATIDLPVFDDDRNEGTEELTFSLQADEGYEIDSDERAVTFAIEDDDAPALPTLSLSASSTELAEGEDTATTLTFNLDQAPPQEGITVTVDSETANAIAEFDLEAVEVTGGNSLTPNADRSGFSFTITEQTATVSLPAFDDDEGEGAEELAFSLQATEDYEVDPDEDSITLNIEDNDDTTPQPPADPVVSFTASPTRLVEADSTETTLTFALNRTPSEEGLVVTVDSDIPNSLEEFDLAAREVTGGNALTPNDDLSGFSFTLTESTASISLPVFSDGEDEGSENITYSLGASEDYTVDSEASSVTFDLLDATEAEPLTLEVDPQNNIFFLDGSPSQSTNLQFELTGSNGDFASEVGLFVVDDDNGGIDTDGDGEVDVNPDDANYIEAALRRGQTVLSSVPENSLPNPNLTTGEFSGNSRVAFYLVSNSTSENVLSGITPPEEVLFGSAIANNGSEQLQITERDDEGAYTLSWEDLPEEGDSDFNDLVLSLQATEDNPPLGTALQATEGEEFIDLRNVEQEVTASFEVSSEAAFDNFVGLYRVDNRNGQIDDLLPGDAGYAAAAIERRVVSFNREGTDSLGLADDELGLLAPFIIANGNPEEFLENNPDNQEANLPVAYFNYQDANPDAFDHIVLLGSNTFGFEDLPGGGDRDFNDIVFQVDFA